MELTIQIPWLSRMRRIGIGLSLVLVLVALALPASAAAPEGIEGEVTVVNEPTNPVPITGNVTADVTGSVNVAGTVTVDNEATDPVPVSGDVTADVSGSVAIDGTVAATQSGTWTVGLDATSAGDLANINASTDPLTYDANGNLNVNIAASDLGAGEVILSDGAGLCGAILLLGDTSDTFAISAPVTALTVHANESLRITLENETGAIYRTRVDATGHTFAPTFAFPLDADTLVIRNLSEGDLLVADICVTTL